MTVGAEEEKVLWSIDDMEKSIIGKVGDGFHMAQLDVEIVSTLKAGS